MLSVKSLTLSSISIIFFPPCKKNFPGTAKLMMTTTNKFSDMNEGIYSLEREKDKKSSIVETIVMFL